MWTLDVGVIQSVECIEIVSLVITRADIHQRIEIEGKKLTFGVVDI
jgi:hypothetical protein